MSDETDVRDLEKERILDRNVHEISRSCNDLMRLSESVRDIGLDKLADNIDIIWGEIRNNVFCIQGRYEYAYKVEERKHFTVEE